LLCCEKIVKPNVLRLNKHNIVIHESALPKGKGWSPLTWQILEGKNKIPIYLFEANEKVDSGPIYLKDEMNFDGSELLKQLKNTQGKKTIKLALNYVDNLNGMKGVKQTGKSTFYKKRTSEDSRLDLNKKLGDQFNLLRVCDNKRYPAFFDYLGHRYVIKIYKNDKTSK
jgi:methionyl-tRNA formyltransferase